MSADSVIVIGIDDAELDRQLDRIGVETAIIAENIEEIEDEARVVKEQVNLLDEESRQVYRKTIQGARQVASLVRGLAVATGDAFNEIYAIGIEVTLLTAEVLLDIATAEASTLVGAIGIGARIGQIIALIAKAQQLRQGQTEAAGRTEGIIASFSAIEALSYL